MDKSLHRPPKPKPINPIEAAIRSWFETLPVDLIDSLSSSLETLISTAPKRWTVYTPMCLLPSGSFESDWELTKQRLHLDQKSTLWQLILRYVSKREGKGPLTHLAINSGIPLSKASTDGYDDDERTGVENILRTPSGLIMLHGDFGPDLSPDASPSSQDFEDAFWVSTKQNGITQIWAPRYTMFSRGNIKEKARLLDFHRGKDKSREEEEEVRSLSDAELGGYAAVDLYAGIGYFVFSYVMMGMGRVIGWELNPWSVEGLRRGAVANGWSVAIVKSGQEVKIGDERIVIFQEDNQKVEARLLSSSGGKLADMKVLHVNCGLLPTSLPVWRIALGLVNGEGWLHLHENVGVNDISERGLDITQIFTEWSALAESRRAVRIDHVELVKTFAPGVWHCVFDLFVSSGRN